MFSFVFLVFLWFLLYILGFCFCNMFHGFCVFCWIFHVFLMLLGFWFSKQVWSFPEGRRDSTRRAPGSHPARTRRPPGPHQEATRPAPGGHLEASGDSPAPARLNLRIRRVICGISVRYSWCFVFF